MTPNIRVALVTCLLVAACSSAERGALTADEERRLDRAEAMLDEPLPGGTDVAP